MKNPDQLEPLSETTPLRVIRRWFSSLPEIHRLLIAGEFLKFWGRGESYPGNPVNHFYSVLEEVRRENRHIIASFVFVFRAMVDVRFLSEFRSSEPPTWFREMNPIMQKLAEELSDTPNDGFTLTTKKARNWMEFDNAEAWEITFGRWRDFREDHLSDKALAFWRIMARKFGFRDDAYGKNITLRLPIGLTREAP